jgi:hypothetical protein
VSNKVATLPRTADTVEPGLDVLRPVPDMPADPQPWRTDALVPPLVQRLHRQAQVRGKLVGTKKPPIGRNGLGGTEVNGKRRPFGLTPTARCLLRQRTRRDAISRSLIHRATLRCRPGTRPGTKPWTWRFRQITWDRTWDRTLDRTLDQTRDRGRPDSRPEGPEPTVEHTLRPSLAWRGQLAGPRRHRVGPWSRVALEYGRGGGCGHGVVCTA